MAGFTARSGHIVPGRVPKGGYRRLAALVGGLLDEWPPTRLRHIDRVAAATSVTVEPARFDMFRWQRGISCPRGHQIPAWLVFRRAVIVPDMLPRPRGPASLP